MNSAAAICPYCGLVGARKNGRDRQGRQIHQCRDCRRRFTALTGTPFAGYRFPPDIIALAVRWYLRFRLSYADVAELLAERGVGVDASTTARDACGHCAAARRSPGRACAAGRMPSCAICAGASTPSGAWPTM
jgi:hypothetical protein